MLWGKLKRRGKAIVNIFLFWMRWEMFHRWPVIDGSFFFFSDSIYCSQDAAAEARTHVTVVI